MPALDLDARVLKAFYVRKRKKGRETFLIYLTTIYAIDEFSETLWDLSTGDRAIRDLVREMRARYPALDPVRCLSLVAHNVLVLLGCRMLTVVGEDPAARAAPPVNEGEPRREPPCGCLAAGSPCIHRGRRRPP